MPRQFMLLLILGLFTLSFLVACSNDQERGITDHGSQAQEQAEWTVLYYGAGNYAEDMLGADRSGVLSVLQGLEDVYPSPSVNVVALISSQLTGAAARYYEIQYRPDDSRSEVHSRLLSDWGPQDLSASAVLRQFIDSTTVRCPANKYMLVMGGEGEGWRGACLEEENNNVSLMSLPALSTALQSVTLRSQPLLVDVLVWLAPKMSTLEAAYELRPHVHYMVASSFSTRLDYTASTRFWLQDLVLNPAMDGELLGRFAVSRMHQAAAAVNDSLTSFSLLDLSQVEPLTSAVDSLAAVLRGFTAGHAVDLMNLRQVTWVSSTDDTLSVDLEGMLWRLENDPNWNRYPDLLRAAANVRGSLQNSLVLHYTTRPFDVRGGLTVCFPPADQILPAMPDYAALSLSTERGGWKTFLEDLSRVGNRTVRINGTARWAGHTLDNLYLFLNRAQTGTPVMAATVPATIVRAFTPDSVSYQALCTLADDSLRCYIGIFQDLDHNQILSSGDRFGYYAGTTPPRKWLTLHARDVRDSVGVNLNLTY